jgi:hypothetical protein
MNQPRVPKESGGTAKGAGRDYEVGYGRPPVATRFQPGGFGNPKGRPRKQKSVGKIIQEALMIRVTIEENGRSRTMTAQELIFRNLVSAAAHRDVKAIYALLALKERYQDSNETTLDPAQLQPEDQQIIEGYLATLRAKGTDISLQTPIEGTQNLDEDKTAGDKANGTPEDSQEVGP